MAKRTIAATKPSAGGRLWISVQAITDNQQVVLQTKEGYFLRFPAQEVSEKKKGAIGVRGIKLRKNDELEHAYLFEKARRPRSSLEKRK